MAYKFVSSHPGPIGGNPDSIESSFFTKLQEGHQNLITYAGRVEKDKENRQLAEESSCGFGCKWDCPNAEEKENRIDIDDV